MRNVIFCFVLVLLMFCVSGCATILGGIIGHQSGEWVAGAAIGAGVDFGGGIVDGIGGLLTDSETRFEQKVSLDSVQGKIVLAKNEYSIERIEKMMAGLAVKFDENGWSHRMAEKKILSGKTLLWEKWECKNAGGEEFELSVSREKCKDTHVLIGPAGQSIVNKDVVTVEVYTWLKEASAGT